MLCQGIVAFRHLRTLEALHSEEYTMQLAKMHISSSHEVIGKDYRKTTQKMYHKHTIVITAVFMKI